MISPSKWFAKLPRSVATSAAMASVDLQTLADRHDFQSMSAPGCGASVTCELLSRRNPCCEEVSRAFAQLESL